MPLLLDNIRAEFTRFIASFPDGRLRIDAAIAHVITMAYQQGLNENKHLPASIHSPADCSAAFEWLRIEATKDGASEHAGVVLDELHALATGRFSYGGPPQFLGFDLVAHLHRQRDFSERTFGPGDRAKGVVDHIRKELIEIDGDPKDLSEWIDVVLLALDGAWRQGYTPEQIAIALEAKQTKNEGRQWPDWRTAEPGKAIEHVRDQEQEVYAIPAFLHKGDA